jgi:acyl-CoA thioesterase I
VERVPTLQIALRWLVLLPLLAGGCSDRAGRSAASSSSSRTAASEPGATAEAGRRIVFLGDSLTAGPGLQPSQSYPALVQARLIREGYPYHVVNAGVSGDTSAGGLRRLDWALDGDVAILVVALGANDGLRGLSPAELGKNLAAIVEAGKQQGTTVLLAGMEAPPNNGPEYTAAFRQVYADVAKRHRVPFLPFLLQDVAGEAALNQADGIHPNERGAKVIADTLWDALRPLLEKPRR